MFALLLVTMTTFAQGAETDPIDYSAYIMSFAALAGGLPFVVEFFRSKIGIRGLGLQLVSWTLGIIVAIICNLINVGMFEGLELWEAIVLGFFASLASNGVANTGVITGLLSFFGIQVKK